MSVRILIVDDAPFARKNLSKMFEENGWQIVGEAGNGREAVSQYLALKPDVVTMDITMPGMDGIEAVKAIVKQDPTAKIIMCSAVGQQDKVVEAVQSGAKGFIVKPFQKERIIAAVEKVMNK